MENLFHKYFEPLSLENLEYFQEESNAHCIGSIIKIHTENNFPELSSVKIAIIGVPEERNAYDNIGCSKAPNEIRKQFYRLFKLDEMPEIADLGNFIIGKTIQDTYRALGDVIAYLIENKIVVVILGGSQDISFANYLAYEKLKEVINITSIDSTLNMGNKISIDSSNAFFHKIVLRQPNYLFNYSNIGYQSYFVNPDDVLLLDKLRFDAYRLGIVQENLLECEPVLRDSNMVNIDMSVLKFSDSPGCRQSSPNGLNGREICALCKFSGASDKLTSFGIYEYNPLCDIAEQSAKLIAEMLWYFIDGFNLRKNDRPDLMKDNYIKYEVGLQNQVYKIYFYQSKISNLWWMEVPCADKKAKYERNYLIPCSRKDYETACKDELPERWLTTYRKLEKIL